MELDFIPETLASLWRAAIILFGAALAGKICFGLIDKKSFIYKLPPERKLAWFGVLVFIVQSVWFLIDRFNDPVLLRGIPISTIAFVIFWLAIRHIRDPAKDCE
jgi:hypothetical protein